MLISATMQRLVLLALCAAATSAAASGGDVDTYSFPAFDARTEDIVAVTNTSITGLALLFGPASSSDEHYSRVNHSEGFLLLSQRVGVWRAGDVVDGGGVPEREASFNTSFSLAGSSAVAFVVLRDIYPPFLNRDGFRGPGNVTFAPDAAASGGLAAVEAGAVRAYGQYEPGVGLNVTVTPNGTAPSRTVWIEYDAAAHRLLVYVAAGATGASSRPPEALLDATIRLAAGRRTTQNASVGFFAGAVRDVIVGVRGWNMTLERLDGRISGAGEGRKKGTSCAVILLVVLGSVAVMF
ncbi:hypothetical protein SETIT_7G010500v2 [Setaria italica]|uniref:Legume lectin domain-containing protein n=1 Tax=Setaria italica TaxID=4555 RepID=A0A368RSK6_SETIT|nr:uncharacterized protein LOC101771298 [Setaria italica]RCV32530.1 hypothetical protein SETIT_7G010500v2 [Setaria italica]